MQFRQSFDSLGVLLIFVNHGMRVGHSTTNESRVGALIALPRVLEELQLAPGEIFRQAGVASDLFDDPNNRARLEDVCRLLAECERASGKSEFGLMVGRRFTLDNLGLLGEVMRNSSTVGDALRALHTHLHFDDRGAVPVLLRPEPGTLLLGYLILHPPVAGSAQLLDAVMAVANRIMRELCGPGWRLRRIQFSHRQPDNTAAYRELFGRVVHFDAEFSALCFDADWLERRVMGADPRRLDQLESSLRQRRGRFSISFTEEVECILHGLLVAGNPRSANVARALVCSERSLRLKLQREGTTLQRLLHAARCERACHLLRNTELPVSQIATAMCYADPAVFARAFHGWTGVSPRQWRTINREQ